MPPDWVSRFHCLVRREVLLTWRRRGALAMLCGFYLLLTALAPFALTNDAAQGAAIGGGIVWLFFLLSLCLSLDRLIASDRQDGSLQQILLSGTQPFLLGLAKAAGLWLGAALPLLILTPLSAVLLRMDSATTIALALSLLAGSPGLCLLATLGASLTSAARPQAALLPLLLLPLYVPILIFGSAIPAAASQSLSYTGPILWLMTISLLALALCPLLTALGLRSGHS